MKVQIIQIAKTKNSEIAKLEEEFEKRIKAYFSLESINLPASKSDERMLTQSEEKTRIVDKVDKSFCVVALDERGEQMTSPEFAEYIKKQRDFGKGKIQFLIGGSHGLHPDILKLADYKLSLSKMSFTHEMVRVFLKEQLYRAGTIIAGKTYHK